MELLTGYAIPGLLLGILLAVLLVSRRRAERTGLRTAGPHALNALLQPALSPRDVGVMTVAGVVMPRLNGCELGELLAVEPPGLRVLFIAGYTDDDVIRRGLLRPGSPSIQKPFLPAALARKVREELDSRCSS
jgi:FixJ family two-component response regulator